MTLIQQISLLSFVFLSGCTTQVQVKPIELPIFSEPKLVPVTPQEVQCLDAKTYSTIVDRESLLRKWGQQNFNVIEVNNKKATQK